MPPAVLECEALTVARGGRAVLHDVTLSLPAEAGLAIIGPNGSGKTTLLLSLLGLVAPQSGAVRLDGAPVHTLAPGTRARRMAYVPQRHARAPAFTVRQIIADGRYAYAGDRAPLHDAGHVDAALQRCGLTALADRVFNTLSGGERQKTLLAAAIAQDAQLLMLDEPNTGLDPGYQIELVRILRAWRAAGRGFVLVSHDLQLPAAVADRVVALRAGRVVAAGPAGEVLTPAALGAVYDARFGVATDANGATFVIPAWDRA